MKNPSKILLYIIILCLCICALIGISSFIFGEFGDLQFKSLTTSLLLGIFTATALGNYKASEKPLVRSLSILGIIFSITSFVLCEYGVLTSFSEFSSDLLQFLGTILVLTFGISYNVALYSSLNKTKPVTYLIIATSITCTLSCFIIIMEIYSYFKPDEIGFRALGTFAILTVLGTLIIPILNKVLKK